MATLPIALIQTRTPASPAAALAHVEPLIREAAASGARLILTPEATNFLIRDPAARAAVLTDQDGDAVVIGLRALAQELGVWLLIGSAIVQSGYQGDDRAANRSLLIDGAGADQMARAAGAVQTCHRVATGAATWRVGHHVGSAGQASGNPAAAITARCRC
jgi:predicted amidohydrolase